MSKIRVAIVFGGALSCLALAAVSLGMMFYYHHVSGSWLDDRIFDWEIYPPIGIVGTFLFTRVIGPLLGVIK